MLIAKYIVAVATIATKRLFSAITGFDFSTCNFSFTSDRPKQAASGERNLRHN
jgi:hypothetical protein